MILQCGYLPGTNSMCYHPIQNVSFWGVNWSTCNIILNNKIIYTIQNNGSTKYVIEQISNDDYKIELKVNNNKIYQHGQLYYVDLEFDFSPEYELVESLIVDH